MRFHKSNNIKKTIWILIAGLLLLAATFGSSKEDEMHDPNAIFATIIVNNVKTSAYIFTSTSTGITSTLTTEMAAQIATYQCDKHVVITVNISAIN